MRWERLFADLEARLAAEERNAWEGDLADLVRAERAQLTLADRLRAHLGESLTWSLGFGDPSLDGELLDVGADWVLIKAVRGETLIPIAAVQCVGGLSRAAGPDPGVVARRLGLGVVLRGLARDRAAVSVVLRGELSLVGTIDRIGKDHLDLAVHAADRPRRSNAVHAVRCLPIQAIVSLTVR
jgi:hypothetical protein